MKTYKTTIEKPRLVISYDRFPENPREYGTMLGYFLTLESQYKSPDGDDSEYYKTMIETQKEAKNVKEHMELIKKAHKDIVAIYPITRYEHGNVMYKLGSLSGFDYSNCGFYIITKETLEYSQNPKEEDFKKIINDELDQYNAFVNWLVYSFMVYDENGELLGEHSGYYSEDEIKDCLVEEYGDEWKDENMEDYFIN